MRESYSIDDLLDMALQRHVVTQYPFVYEYPASTALNQLTFYAHDHLGNLRVAFTPVVDCNSPTGTEPDPLLNHPNSSFTLEQVVDYYPYGKVLRQYVNSNGPERYLSTQHERDQETELDYRGARYYDSDVARFLSLDPLAADYAAWSPYNYVMGNPISLIDPTGRSATNYVTEAGAPIANTRDGNEATVTIGNEHLEAFRKELSQMVVDKDSPSNNAEWIGAYGKGMAANQGQNVPTWAMSALRGGASDQGVDWGLVGSVSFFSEQGFNGVAALAKASANFNPHYAYRGMAEAEAAAARGLGNIAKVTKAAGGSAMGINMGATALGYYQSDRSGADKARYWGGVTITAIGVCYPPVGIGLGALEAVGTFDSFYNSFDPEDLVR